MISGGKSICSYLAICYNSTILLCSYIVLGIAYIVLGIAYIVLGIAYVVLWVMDGVNG